jgi:hypothetical protein
MLLHVNNDNGIALLPYFYKHTARICTFLQKAYQLQLLLEFLHV